MERTQPVGASFEDGRGIPRAGNVGPERLERQGNRSPPPARQHLQKGPQSNMLLLVLARETQPPCSHVVPAPTLPVTAAMGKPYAAQTPECCEPGIWKGMAH